MDRIFRTMAFFYCLGVIQSPAAWAQEPAVEHETGGQGVEEIVVTGSHIKRTDYDGPQPVVVFDRAYLERTGFRNLADFERYLPESHQTLTEGAAFTGIGVPEAASFNLRGQGADSTLTLVNGLRVAPYGGAHTPFTDISAIPMSAIERIEILKDGASAIYGSDAVAGVINIILRKDFVGTEVSGGYQLTSRGDNAEWNVDVYHGGQKGAFNYMLGFFYDDREPLYNRDRAHSADPDFSDIGGYNHRSPAGSPGSIFRLDTFTMHADPACGTDPLTSNVREDGPDEEFCAFNYNQYDMMYLDRQRAGLNVKAGYEFGNGTHLFTDVIYSRKDTFHQTAPAPLVSEVPVEHPNNPYGVPLLILYRVLDAGPRQFDAASRQYRVTVGLEGMAGRWGWNASLLDSKNRVSKFAKNSINVDEFQEALMGQGGPNGDQYYNPFGYLPQNDPAVIDGFTAAAESGDRRSESALDLVASTAFGRLPGGPIKVAIGGQWRRQELEEIADEVWSSGRLAGLSADFLVDYADREIGAVFAELSLPVWKGLDVQLAARYEHYSDFGDTTNPKLALRWQLFEPFALRASWGTSFHAPNFFELYQNPVERTAYLIDTPRCELTGLDADCDRLPYPMLDSGNPLLEPEIGESWYAGFEWAPVSAPELAFALGYWKLDYDDRIEWVAPQFIVEHFPADNPWIERAPPTPEEAAAGIPGRIIQTYVTAFNLSRWLTDGYDAELSHRWTATDMGDFGLRLNYTYTKSWDATLPEIFGFAEYSMAGRYWNGPIPRNRGNLSLDWQLRRDAANATVHYVGHYRNWMDFLPVDGEESDIPFIVDSHLTLDLQYSLQFDALEGAKLRVGCQNCTDADPPFTHDTGGENIHDGRGLIWYVNWTQAF